MKCTNWNEEDWLTLIHAIRHDECILMLGPGAAFEEANGQIQPLTAILANELVKNIAPQDIKAWNIDPSNLVQVSQYYAIKKRKHALKAKVEVFYSKRRNTSSELHRNLATLPFSLVITATPDEMFCTALPKKKEFTKKRYNLKGNNPDIVEEEDLGTVEKPLVFYLYGIINEPESLVLSENDFLDFLVAVISKNPLPNYILSKLRDKQKSLLFLGFDFRQWYLRILLHVLQVSSKDSRSFALEQFTPDDSDDFQKTILFYRESDYNIHFCNMDLQHFVKDLKAKYEEEYASINSFASPPKFQPQQAPSVFLCHAKEDREYAKNLRKGLIAADIKAWFDEEDVPGGEEWDSFIERTIKDEIDYFLVLQSKALLARDIGYVNKEINLALERQKEFRPSSGIRFIIPLKIENCPLLEDLNHLQTIDISNKENIQELIKEIKRDQERRKKK